MSTMTLTTEGDRYVLVTRRFEAPPAADARCGLIDVTSVHRIQRAPQFPSKRDAQGFDARCVSLSDPIGAARLEHFANDGKRERVALEDERAKA